MKALPTARWLTTLTPGDRWDRRTHYSLAGARGRAAKLVGHPAARMTIWFNNDDMTGWHSWAVVDLHQQAGVA